MKITRNIWRIQKNNRSGAWTFGAIIELGSQIIFVYLDERDDELRFNDYLAAKQNWFECAADYAIIDDISLKFCIEEYDSDYYIYSIKDSMVDFQPSNDNV